MLVAKKIGERKKFTSEKAIHGKIDFYNMTNLMP